MNPQIDGDEPAFRVGFRKGPSIYWLRPLKFLVLYLDGGGSLSLMKSKLQVGFRGGSVLLFLIGT